MATVKISLAQIRNSMLDAAIEKIIAAKRAEKTSDVEKLLSDAIELLTQAPADVMSNVG